MKISTTVLEGAFFLAPMAGITDLPFRLMCKRFGADLVYTEMINAKAVCYGDPKTFQMLKTLPEEGPVAVQLFGSEPLFMRQAASIVSQLGKFCLLDVNMGCPAPKVVKSGDGSALMRDPALAMRIVEAVKTASSLPVTVKFRKGWDEENINALEFARQMQESGADALTIHGRTRSQYYAGQADWQIVREIKEQCSIPVMGSGDLFEAGEIINKKNTAGIDAVMIARGAQGNPFIFRQCRQALTGQVKEITPAEKIQAAIAHYTLALTHLEEYSAVREMRKHLGWYVKGLRGNARIKESINALTDPQKVLEALQECLEAHSTAL